MIRCGHCGGRFERTPGRGRAPRFCASACKQSAYRRRFALPSIMRESARWTRGDGKRPITRDGWGASSTDPTTWARYDDVLVGAGDGVGVMLGSGLGCYDLDHCTLAEAKSFARDLTETVIYAERSMSGSGFHLFFEGDESPGWKRNGVERYTRSRFIRMTFDRVRL